MTATPTIEHKLRYSHYKKLQSKALDKLPLC